MKFMPLIVVSTMLIPATALQAQTTTVRLFVAVLSNKSYTVGARNPGTGLFVGDEQGREWRNLAFPNMRTFAIEVLPQVGDGLIYTANGNGVIVSRDGGKHWRVTTGWQITEVLKIAVDPRNPAVVYIGTAYGAYRSDDFGETWQPLNRRFVYSLHLDVERPERLYIGEDDGLLISEDGGRRFRRVKGLRYPILSLAQDKVQPQRLLLSTEDDGLFLSTDRGKSWQAITTAPEGCTAYQIVFSPHNPREVFAATFAHGVLLSHDGGQTWQGEQSAFEGIPVHCVAVHPSKPQVLYAGTLNEGIYRSDDGGRTWHPFALQGTHVMEIEIR